MTNYIYLIQEREFIEDKKKKNIFKIGKTTQDRFKRLNGYPKGSEIIIWIQCNNCHKIENEIIKIFKTTFLHKKQYGNEYFEGNCMTMVKIIFNTIENEKNNIDNDTNNDNELCIACNGSGISYWSDGIYGNCLECRCIDCGKEKCICNIKYKDKV